jgi:chemotaxis protein MotB
MRALPLLMVIAFAAIYGCGGAQPCTKSSKVSELETQIKDKDKELHNVKRFETERVEALSETNQQLSRELQDEIKEGTVTITELQDRLTLSVVEELLFDSGSAKIRKEGLATLDKVANMLRAVQNRLIMVEGHTDNVPIGPKVSKEFPTNWELSAARAIAVVRYLQEKGVDPKHLGAAGFSMYRPVVANDNSVDRQKNRRIDIVLTPEITAIPEKS